MSIFTTKTEKPSAVKAAVNILLLTVAILAFFWFALSKVGVDFNFSFVITEKNRLLDGFLMTLYISVCSLVLSLILGTLSAIMQNSKVLLLRYFAKFYVTIIRGTPLIVQIYLLFYIVGTAMGVTDRFISGVLILSAFEGAYISEIIRGSLLSLDQTQLEAAKAVGFTKGQTARYVIMPQMVARTLPALTGQFASIIKDSSLLSLISLIELTQTTREITAMNLELFEGYFVLGVLYLILTLPISYISKGIERRFSYENRD